MIEVRRDWWDEMDDMQRQMDRFLGHFVSQKRRPVVFTAGVWQPLVDVYQTVEQVIVVAELAGVSADDVNIVVQNNVLTLTGERRDSRATQRRIYQIMELSFGRFERSIELPVAVDPGTAGAHVENGLLVIAIDKAPKPTMKRVQLRMGNEADDRRGER